MQALWPEPMTSVRFACDLCGEFLTCPRGRDSRDSASISYEDRDRLFSKTGFRFKGTTIRAITCGPCWCNKVMPALVELGMKFDVRVDTGEEDMKFGPHYRNMDND